MSVFRMLTAQMLLICDFYGAHNKVTRARFKVLDRTVPFTRYLQCQQRGTRGPPSMNCDTHCHTVCRSQPCLQKYQSCASFDFFEPTYNVSVIFCNCRRPHSHKEGYIELFLFSSHKCVFFCKAPNACFVSPLVFSVWH